MSKNKIIKWSKEKCIEELKQLYEEHGILNATTIHTYKGGMAKYIEKNFGSLSIFCEENDIKYLFKMKKNNWTENKARVALMNFYEERGIFSSSELMAYNSGLEKYLRNKHEGVRSFCEKNKISYILKAPKKINWTVDKAGEIIKAIFEDHNEFVGQSNLTKYGYGGLYQWACKKFGSYKEFILQNNLEKYTSYQQTWTDLKCFRLIKQVFIEQKGPYNPEIIKKQYKGAYNYIYTTHGSFDEFLKNFDLQDFVEVNNIIYDDEIVIRRIKEAFYKKGDKVYSKWLHENGYGGSARYLTNIGNGNFIKGAEKLGLSNFVSSRYVEWTDELALQKIEEMFKEKNEALIAQDFIKYRMTGLRDWIIKNNESLPAFFTKHEIEDKFVNMRDLGKTLWALGLQFEALAKEVLEKFFNNIIYNKKIDDVRPDFVLPDGIWIDAKLSSTAYFTDETVRKYTAKDSCKELWLLYLRGHKFKHGRTDVKLIAIDEFYCDLQKMGFQDLIDKIESLRLEVEELEKAEKNKLD